MVLQAREQGKPWRNQPKALLLQHLPSWPKRIWDGLTGATARPPKTQAEMLQGLFAKEPEQEVRRKRARCSAAENSDSGIFQETFRVGSRIKPTKTLGGHRGDGIALRQKR